VQHGGQEPVGEGEEMPLAGAGSGQPGTVAAARVQAFLPLLVMQFHQRGDQSIPVPGRQAGQRRVAEPGQVGAGLVERIGDAGGLVVFLWVQGVVPLCRGWHYGPRDGGPWQRGRV